MAFDTNKLRGRIVEKFGSLQNFCNETGYSYATLQSKLSHRAFFNQKEISNFQDWLGISGNEVTDYFFKERVQKTEQNTDNA